MDARRLIRKPLQPARPIRRILPGSGAVYINFQATFTDCKDNFKDPCNMWYSIEKLHDVFKDPVIEKPLEEAQRNHKKDRITYTRDSLLQLSKVSVSRKKPKYLPDLPIILQDPFGQYKKGDKFPYKDGVLAKAKIKKETDSLFTCTKANILAYSISSLYCAIDPFSPADMENTPLSASPDHGTYHRSQDDALIYGL